MNNRPGASNSAGPAANHFKDPRGARFHYTSQKWIFPCANCDNETSANV